jgi:hypothetical protein
MNTVLVVVPKNTNVAVAFPTIFPPEPVIEPMAVVNDPGLRVKFPEVMVNAINESEVTAPLLPPNVTPPTPFKIKLAGYVKKVLFGKVNGLRLVNLTVPFLAEICPLVRDIVLSMLNIPVVTLIWPEVNTIVPTAVIPDVKVKFPEVMVKDRNESVNAPKDVPPKVTPPVPFKIKLAGYLLNVLLGKVTGLVFVNITVPLGAEICPVCVVPLRVTVPPMLNVPVETFIVPDVITKDPTANVPEPKFTGIVLSFVYSPEILKVPELNWIVELPLVNVPVLVNVNDPRLSVLKFNVSVVLTSKFDPNVKFDVPFNVKTFTALLVPGVVWLINSVFVFDP